MLTRVNPLLAAVAAPPIAEAHGWIAGRTFPDDKKLIDLCQAVPGYPPPDELTQHLAARIGEPAMARYTDILGLPELRGALAQDAADFYGTVIEPAQVAITAGCNQAYCLAMMALAGAGDEVILPLPYYFNHQMWLDMLGVRAVHLPFRPERGGVPDPAEAAALIGPRTRAIVLVSPNNPTGAVYPAASIAAFYQLARDRGIALVLDETYRDFLPSAEPPHCLFEEPDWADTLVHLYSFSKVYCLTGYRVGAAICGAALAAEIAKAMDCVSICAPRIGQEAALYGIRRLGAWRADKRRLMGERLSALTRALTRNDTGYELVSAGAYFAYLRHPFGAEPAVDVARRLVAEQNLLALPGSMFGPGQEPFLRFAFANVEAALMEEVAARLAASAGLASSGT
jgi:aspartate/methionine/tyrosine aminotransferase